MLAAVSMSTRLPPGPATICRHTSSPVHAGQVPVEHHDVVAGRRQVLERVGAVEDHVDRHALAAQPGPDRAGQDLEVLDDQHSHASTMPGRRCQPGVDR